MMSGLLHHIFCTNQANRMTSLAAILISLGVVALACDDLRNCFRRGPFLNEIATAFEKDDEQFRFKYNVTQLQTMCKEWNNTISCYNREIRWCWDDEKKAKSQAIRNVVEYTCNKGFNDYVKYSPCFASDKVENRMKSCEDRLLPEVEGVIQRRKEYAIDQTEFEREFCRLTFGIGECWWRIVEEDCGKKAMESYRTLTNEIFKPVYTAFKCYEAEGCKIGYGSTYDGKTSFTNTGKTCQRWDSQYPHKHTMTDPSKFPEDSLSDAANYCRNPDLMDDGPWCYTTDPDVRWEYCAVRKCQVDRRGTKSKGLSTGTILGIVSGSLALLSGLCSLIGFCIKTNCCNDEEKYPEVDPQPHQMSMLNTDKENPQSDQTAATWSKPEDYKPEYTIQNGKADDNKV